METKGTASKKQISYILHLMAEAGYSTDWMNARHKALGATMRERSGRVIDWLAKMDSASASSLITDLTS
jgi:cobalamin biosynthesis Mg chelatase CobN